MKLLKRIIIACCGVFALSLLTLFVLANVFEEEIIAQAKSSINEAVDTQIDVGEIRFSLVHDFPKASLLFEKVAIVDKLDTDQYLLQAQKVSLEFDILQILRSSYVIDKASIENGSLNMRTGSDGEMNFIFWRSTESDSELSFDIESLVLTNIDYDYKDEPAELSLHTQISKANIEGGLKDKWFSMRTDLSGSATRLNVSGSDYLHNNEMDFRGEIRFDEDGRDIYFEESNLSIGPVNIPIQGRVFKEEFWNVDLEIEGKADLQEFLAELPKDQKGNLDQYFIEGNIDYSMRITGETNGITHPLVQMEYTLNNGKFKLAEKGSYLEKIDASGSYQRSIYGIDKIEMISSNASVDGGALSYTGIIQDFDRPMVNGNLSGQAQLFDMMAVTGKELIQDMEGTIQIGVRIDGILPDSDNWTPQGLERLNIFGKAVFEEVEFRIVDNGYSISGLNTEFVLENDKILLDVVDLLVNGDHISIEGSISGICAYGLTEQGVLSINTDIRSDQINWDNWKNAIAKTGTESFELADNINMNVSFNIADFQYDKIRAKEVKGLLASKGRSLQLDPITLLNSSGRISAGINLDQHYDKSWDISIKGSIAEVDMTQLFYQFDGFGQQFLSSQQLKGKGDAIIRFSASMDSLMNIDMSSIYSDADLAINQGELIAHPSMIGIVDELRERHLLKPFVRADELENEVRHLRFQSLSNTIRIEDGVIHIPKMIIANNAMDIGISGSHGFDDQIDYTVDFTLRDILVNKSNPEFLIQDDGLGHRIHLKMTGTVDNPIIELDKSKSKENRKEAIAEAKKDIKEFFSNPFKKKAIEKDERPEIQIELEDGDDQSKTEVEEKQVEPDKKQWWKIADESEEEDADPDEEDDF